MATTQEGLHARVRGRTDGRLVFKTCVSADGDRTRSPLDVPMTEEVSVVGRRSRFCKELNATGEQLSRAPQHRTIDVEAVLRLLCSTPRTLIKCCSHLRVHGSVRKIAFGPRRRPREFSGLGARWVGYVWTHDK